MSPDSFGRILKGSEDTLRQAYDQWVEIPVDQELNNGDDEPASPWERTIERPASVSGPGTFFGKTQRTVRFAPTEHSGWWLDRADLPDCLPTKTSVHNVWTTGAIVRNIVLRSGPPENYVRMVEHMVALKLGMGVDNLVLRLDSGDPPLFDRGSLELAETLENAGITEQNRKARYITVKESVSVAGPNNDFLTIHPCQGPKPALNIDCAVDFPNAIGKQRIRFPLTADNFAYGAQARTNTTAGKRLYCLTVGKIFADIRNLGYTDSNLLVAGRKSYRNTPGLVNNGKSLEVVWHRAALDLLAALALIDGGRFVGDVVAYKGGHSLDIQMITQLVLNDLITEYAPPAEPGE